jgi:tetratricopeptide (TPR) repeat protein
MTQAQLAAPEFSISYISAIERGKIRPSLRALSVLARRLDVPLTFLLEGSPTGAAEARAVGYSPADAGRDQEVEVSLLQADVLVKQGAYEQAERILDPITPNRITTDQVYRLYLLHGEIHLGAAKYQEAVVDLRAAVTQGEAVNDTEYVERARNLLGRAYFLLSNYTLAIENHLRCNAAIESGRIKDPFFALDVYSNLANDYYRLGDSEKAVAFYHRALKITEGMNRDSRSFAQRYMEISQQYKAASNLVLASDFAMRSLAIYDMRGEQRLVGLIHQQLGKALEKQNNFEEAEQEYHQAIAIESELNEVIATSICHASLAELLLKSSRIEEAEREAQEALTYARSSGDAQTEGQALIMLGRISHQKGDFNSADQLFREALDLLDKSNDHESAAEAYFRFASILEARGEVQGSLEAIKKAYEHQRLERQSSLY